MNQKVYPPASRAGLVLTPTVDRNGRQTRVWRRIGDPEHSQLSRIPLRSNDLAQNQFYAMGFDPRTITNSPWGVVTDVSEVLPGVYSVTSDSGQGLYLTPARQDEVDPRWNSGNDGWYPSDALGWAVVPYTFQEEFSDKVVEQACAYLRDYRPHEYMEITGEILHTDESWSLSAESFDSAHYGEYAATSMEDGVMPDEVIVTASRIGEDGSEEEFIVSKEEIESDGELGKGERKLIDEKRHPRTNPEIEALKRELKDAIKIALVSRFPKSRYLISTYYVTKAAMQGINKKRDAEDEDKFISKDWGLRGALMGGMSQLIIEITNSNQYPRDLDAEYAREVRKYQRRQRARGWLRRAIG